MAMRHVWAAIIGLGFVQGALAQNQAPVPTLRAELMKPLDSHKLKPGAVFYLRTTADWQRPDCTVHVRSVIAAQVVRLASPGKGTELALSFQPMPCAGSETMLMIPLLVALGAKPMAAPDTLQRLMSAGGEAATISQMFNPNPPSFLKVVVPENKFESGAVYTWGGKDPEDSFKMGEVKGIRNLKLTLPQGTPETTLVSSKDLYLDQGTKFLLTMVVAPEPGKTPLRRELAANRIPDRPSPATRAVLPAEVCVATGCVEAVTSGSGPASSGQAVWSRPLGIYGFMPRPNKVILGMGSGLDDDAAVEFLGEDQVLLAFNTHRLVERSALQAEAGQKPRTVRAMLFSRTDGKLIQAQDWPVQNDAGPFLWSLGDGRVLAHIGDDLVIIADGLKVQQRFPLPGPLLFVSSAMAAGPVLVATVKERHTTEQHKKLQAILERNEAIDEDYELTALDGALHLIGSRTVPAEPLRPALLADATVSASADRGGLRFNVQERRWTGEEKRLATLGSGCDVSINTLAAQLLFVSGCEPTNRLRGWYRLITPAGATLLKGVSGTTDLLQQALSDQAGQRLLTVSSNFPADTFASLNIAESDFKQMTVSLFDTKTGKQLFAAHPQGGSAMRQSAALSRAGNWIAVLSGSALQLYAFKPEAQAAAAAPGPLH